jgi:hypothetical protein
VEAQPHPGIVVPTTGVALVVLALARLVIDPGPRPGGLWLAAAVGVAGAGLALWGIGRLRRARAVRRGLSWWSLLRSELVALGLAAALLPAWAALPQGQRDGLMRAIHEWSELIHAARGH